MKTILVIDDNDEIRENTAEILELNNYQVLSAKDGGAGFFLARAHEPALILCDLMMPVTDGPQFIRLAREDEIVKNIPIMLFSAGSAKEIEKDLRNTANGIIKKPFTEQELLSGIKRGFERSIAPARTVPKYGSI